MLVVCKDTLLNPGVLDTRSLPKKFFGRVQVLPRGGSLRLWLRLIVEMQLVRYFSALAPFVVLPFVSRDLALPITQAPIAMIIVIGVVEMKVLRLSDKARAALMDVPEAERRIDTLRFRARAILRSIAAKRGLDSGALSLVVEQSELARVATLTFVSVQGALPKPLVLDLDAAERALVSDLFDDAFTERDLHHATQRLAEPIHEVKIEAQGVAAHARLAAALQNHAAEG